MAISYFGTDTHVSKLLGYRQKIRCTRLLLPLVALIVSLAPSKRCYAAAYALLTQPVYMCGLRDGSIDILNPSGNLTVLGYAPVGSGANAIAVDSQQNVYVGFGTGKTGGDFIEKITPADVVTTFATGLTTVGSLAFDTSGNLYVAEENLDKVIKITPAKVQSNFATLPGECYNLTFDSSGNLYSTVIASFVYKISPAGTVTKFTNTVISNSVAVATDANNNQYYTTGNSVQKVSPTGGIAGFGSTGDGQDRLTSDAVDTFGNIFVSDLDSSDGSYISVFSPAGNYQQIISEPLISGTTAIAVAPSPVPEPAMFAVIISVLMLGRGRRRRKSTSNVGL